MNVGPRKQMCTEPRSSKPMQSIATFFFVGLPVAIALLSFLLFIATHEGEFLLFAVVLGVCAFLAQVILKGASGDK